MRMRTNALRRISAMEEQTLPISSGTQPNSILSDRSANSALQSESRRESEAADDPPGVAAASDGGDLTEEDVSVKREAPLSLWGDEQEDPYVRNNCPCSNM